ncbi:MAG: 2-oxoglutarate dehydrogenase E1 component [Bacteroidetes bacterium]|nr:2-oxoglutarate dehydrogenase E1 component [Bacteroidota bacterium]
MDTLSYLNNADSSALEELYRQYKKNPSSVDSGWQRFFEGFEFSGKLGSSSGEVMKPLEFKVIELINEYRKRGHLFTKTNPVRTRRKYSPTLDIENYGLSASDLDSLFEAGNEIGIGKANLKDILAHLNETYCQSIGVEFAYIRRPEIYEWLKTRMETTRNKADYSREKKLAILEELSRAVIFEKFLHKKFTGQKRFSLEGCESLIPALDALIEKGSESGISEFVIGMPHRGRLNVLANTLGKHYQDIFNEFQGKEFEDETLLGDVKYHLGFSSERQTRSGKTIYLSLAPNPSHLETVGPVVEGITRCKIDTEYGKDASRIVPIIIHGDASVAGQGVVYETIQMSELQGYSTGGSIHLVVNNQIGFTTNYLDARSSVYCTDVAKTIQCPIFHVNADAVEDVVFVMEMAIEFRQKFHKDVFIDLLGYRKYGHNEGDEPRFTQPILYKIIEQHLDPRSIYIAKLIESGAINQPEADVIEKEFLERLESELQASKGDEKSRVMTFLQPAWDKLRYATASDWLNPVETGVEKEFLVELAKKITFLPDGKPFFKKLVKLTEDRRSMVVDNGIFDWAMAELMAYGTLLTEGIPVRLSGQDSQRGTFSHRHAVLTMEESEERYTPLQNISPDQASFEVYNSPLSEYGVMAFEYGYSLASPFALTIWEAQFGDFFNGAQIVIDQYLCSAEEKWRVMNSLVLLLPHGYEGQGPEHSSARIERFLQQCAENNIQVANCSTPANFFHLLRRQVHRDFRKPLVVFTPKSLLRHPACVSPITELATGHFMEVIDDEKVNPAEVSRVDFCSGKVYYDLIAEREKRGRSDVALVRVEQLYPLPLVQLKAILKKYSNAKVFAWVQEEPANMGAWSYMLRNFKEVKLLLVARPESGSPATGSSKLHNLRQAKIIDKAFGDCTCENRNETCKMLCAPREWQFVEEKSR